jgi:protein involved in polysaccharide export with SLBB domain
VSETGRITVPQVGTFRAAGYTETELVEALRDRLSPQIIPDAMVTVVVVQARGKIYSVSGAVPAPGTYELLETDFRIMRALASAGGIPQQNADFAYVVRTVEAPGAVPDTYPSTPAPSAQWAEPVEPSTDTWVPPVWPEEPAGQEPATEVPAGPPAETRQDRQRELLESISPLGEISLPGEFGAAEPAAGFDALDDQIMMAMDVTPVVTGADEAEKPLRVRREDDRLVLEPEEDRQWPVEPPIGAGQEPQARPLPEPPGEPMTPWEGVGQVQQVIRVDLRKLRGGDWTQNLVIRPGDDIQVPLNESGIFSVMGEVARPGAYSMAGERLTLKQAIANAGPLTPTAWPSRCEIIRRISDNEQVTCRVNLRKLFEGTAPDIFLKPHDIVNVGTHPVARFAAVIRQSFRTTYGFGFVYDRNFADVDFGR